MKHFLNLSSFSYIFLSIFLHLLPQFGPPGGWLTHPGRSWLCLWKSLYSPYNFMMAVISNAIWCSFAHVCLCIFLCIIHYTRLGLPISFDRASSKVRADVTIAHTVYTPESIKCQFNIWELSIRGAWLWGQNYKGTLGPVAKFRWSAWLGSPQAGPALWNYPAPPYSRRINTIRQKGQCVTCVTNFWILIISIHTSRFGNRIKQIWQPLLFINGYLRMEYTLFQDFARKIPRPVLPTGRPGHAQSGRTPEFWLRALQPPAPFPWLYATACLPPQHVSN